MSLSVDVRKRLGSFSLDVSFEVADSREICALLARELGIPGKSVYVTYHGVAD